MKMHVAVDEQVLEIILHGGEGFAVVFDYSGWLITASHARRRNSP
jgi:hypothetical protein